MPFPPAERETLLAIKGVGPRIIARLEQLGYDSLAELAGACVDEIVREASQLVGSTCWRNSPQARAAIKAVVAIAEQRDAEPSDAPQSRSRAF